MTNRVVIEPLAERDIRVAALWILSQSRSRKTALGRARRLRAAIATLQDFPQRCPVDPDSEAYGQKVSVLLHGRPLGIYRVLFAIRGGTVHVLTVRHASRRGLAEKVADEGREEADEGRS